MSLYVPMLNHVMNIFAFIDGQSLNDNRSYLFILRIFLYIPVTVT